MINKIKGKNRTKKKAKRKMPPKSSELMNSLHVANNFTVIYGKNKRGTSESFGNPRFQ